jgi:AraC family transcriptional regulator
MHLYLPTTLFRRLSDDFNLPGAPAHSIRYVAGDEVLNQIVLSILFSSQASFTRVFRRTTGMTPGEYRRRRHTSAQILLGTSAPQVQFDHNAATI